MHILKKKKNAMPLHSVLANLSSGLCNWDPRHWVSIFPRYWIST